MNYFTLFKRFLFKPISSVFHFTKSFTIKIFLICVFNDQSEFTRSVQRVLSSIFFVLIWGLFHDSQTIGENPIQGLLKK